MSAGRTLCTWAINWSIGFVVCFAVLFLNAYLEHKHPETERITAQVVNDRAAEYAAINNPARVAFKE